MATVLVTYRQPDSSAWGGRLADQLRRVLSGDQIFIVDSATIDRARDDASPGDGPQPPPELALVVVGPGWLGIDERTGHRLIDDEQDLTRTEVEGALAGGGRVVPVLVGGEAMPPAEVLPASIRPLAALAPVEVSDDHFREDVDRLSLTVLAVDREQRRREVAASDRVQRGSRIILFVVFSVCGMIIPPFAIGAMVAALRSRFRIRRRNGTKGLVLANLGFGLALFCFGISVLWLGGFLK